MLQTILSPQLSHAVDAFVASAAPYYEAASNYLGLAIGIIAWIEALTAIAVAYAQRMIPLRTMAMIDNLLGVMAGLGAASLPTVVKHAVNFPLNATRMREMRQLIASVREANETDLNIEWLKPFMHPRMISAGSQVFGKGDKASEAFMLVDGRIEIPERGVELAAGEIFGEMALFTASGKRTASAVCKTDVRLLVITYEQFEQLYFQNPEFGLYLVRLIVRRLEMNGGGDATSTSPLRPC